MAQRHSPSNLGQRGGPRVDDEDFGSAHDSSDWARSGDKRQGYPGRQDLPYYGTNRAGGYDGYRPDSYDGGGQDADGWSSAQRGWSDDYPDTGSRDRRGAPGVARQQQQPQQFDPDYHQWRTEQMNKLDEDYRSWRSDRYQKFADEFNSWRSSRQEGEQAGKADGKAPASASPSSSEQGKHK